MVKFVAKKDSRTMRFVGFFSKKFSIDFWTTYRWPGQRKVVIAYPSRITNPHNYPTVIAHEMHHARWLAKWWGPWVGALAFIFPLPFLFSGRWFLERRAYLIDIRANRMTVDNVVDTLWSFYGWPWPKPLMRRWFNRQIAKRGLRG